MKIALLALTVLALPAFADDPKPYIVVNGKGASAPPASAAAAPGGFMPTGTAPSAFGANTVHPTASGLDAGAVAALAAAGVGGGAAAAPSQDRSFAGRRISGKKTRGITSHKSRRGVSDSDIPPNYTKPGALIRSEGQLPVYSDPGNARTTSVEGGSFVDINPKYARGAAVSPGVTWGKPDTPPPANPTSGGSGAGGNGVTANGPAITVDNSHSNNINGNQNGGDGNGNGNGNGNGHGNGSQTGFDPAF